MYGKNKGIEDVSQKAGTQARAKGASAGAQDGGSHDFGDFTSFSRKGKRGGARDKVQN